MPKLELARFEHVQEIKGVFFPADMKFRQLIVTGPPGSGKTRLIAKIGGWPEEGSIDLTLKHWWRAQPLSFRPREVHLGVPFIGYEEALTVIDPEFLEAPEALEIDTGRILLPPPKTHFLSPDWRRRYMFEFSVPAAEEVLNWRLERRRRESHPIDEGVTLEQVVRQLTLYRKLALLFHRSGMLMYIRDEVGGLPKYIVAPEASP